jgi:hypothetical protein
VGIADRHAAKQRLDGVVDVTLLDAKELEPVLVNRRTAAAFSPIGSSMSTMNGTSAKTS